MKKKIKSYLVFTGFWYRILMYVAFPVALWALQIFSLRVLGESVTPALVFFLVMAEVLADNWVLGGIQEKGAEKIDYLKTSPRGMKVMRYVLVTDLLRRLLSAAGILLICRFLTGIYGNSGNFETPGMVLFSILLVYALSVLGTFITRFGSMLWLNILMGYVLSAIALVLYLLVGMYGKAGVFNLIFVFLSMAVSALAIVVAMKKVEGSYYDK